MEKVKQDVLHVSQLLDIRERHNLDPNDIAAHFDMLQKEEGADTLSAVPAFELEFEGERYGAGPKLLSIMDEMKRSGELEGLNTNQLIQAFRARIDAEMAGEKPRSAEPPPISPELAEVMRRIDATRDAEGVPNDAQEDVTEFLELSFEYLNSESLFPPTGVALEWMINRLETNGMTATARERLSELIWASYGQMKKEFARTDRNSAKRQRRKGRR